MDELKVKMLDRIEITQNLFLEYHGGKKQRLNSDYSNRDWNQLPSWL